MCWDGEMQQNRGTAQDSPSEMLEMLVFIPTNEHNDSSQGNYISYLKNNYVKAGNVNVHITSFQTIFLATNPSVLHQSFFQKRINVNCHQPNI